MKNKTYLYLTGGLGNQLFQIAAALELSCGGPVVIDCLTGKPRLNSTGKAELASFDLPGNVSFSHNQKSSNFVSKVNGFLLRSRVSPKIYEKNPVFKHTTILLSSIINTFALRRPLILRVNSGVGFDKELKKHKVQMLVGYFQTYRYAEKSSVYECLRLLKPLVHNPLVESYRQLAEEEIPLIVHVRLGDYKMENSFGILTHTYYNSAVTELWSTGKFNKIWLFSDEPESAIDVFDVNFQESIRVIPEVSNSAALTLEVMRFGKGYIIANSSFSWWGAFLSYADRPEVIAPTPWFIDQDEPVELIPPLWIRRNGHV